jgi:hypothetical protein
MRNVGSEREIRVYMKMLGIDDCGELMWKFMVRGDGGGLGRRI